MLSVKVLCVGKLKESYWREACAEYGKRLSAFCKFDIEEVEEARVPENASQAQIDQRCIQRENVCSTGCQAVAGYLPFVLRGGSFLRRHSLPVWIRQWSAVSAVWRL